MEGVLLENPHWLFLLGSKWRCEVISLKKTMESCKGNWVHRKTFWTFAENCCSQQSFSLFCLSFVSLLFYKTIVKNPNSPYPKITSSDISLCLLKKNKDVQFTYKTKKSSKCSHFKSQNWEFVVIFVWKKGWKNSMIMELVTDHFRSKNITC